MKNKCFLFIALLACSFVAHSKNQSTNEFITIAILAKDKAHTLPFFLACIEHQTWPKENTYLYIRTNNNNDDTAAILATWLGQHKSKYACVHFDSSDVAEPVHAYKQHEWNCQRFKVLGKIRQDSVQWAREHNSHYFVVDCDNFIKPHTIEKLMQTQLPVVAPFLKLNSTSYYANYHAAIDENGYFKNTTMYYEIFKQQIKGLIEVPVVHCCYLIRLEILPFVVYDDNSRRYEYVIFSDALRKQNIAQYLDNREIYGYVSFSETIDQFLQEPYLDELKTW